MHRLAIKMGILLFLCIVGINIAWQRTRHNIKYNFMGSRKVATCCVSQLNIIHIVNVEIKKEK